MEYPLEMRDLLLFSILSLTLSACAANTKKIVLGSGKEFSGTICIGKTFKPGLITEAGAFKGKMPNRTGTKVQVQIDRYEKVKISPQEWSLIRGLRLGKTYSVKIYNYKGTKRLLSFKVKIPRKRPHIFIEQKATYGTWGYVSSKSIADECINPN